MVNVNTDSSAASSVLLDLYLFLLAFVDGPAVGLNMLLERGRQQFLIEFETCIGTHTLASDQRQQKEIETTQYVVLYCTVL